MKIKAIISFSLCLLLSYAWAQDSDESVLLINMAYDNGRWYAEPAKVLPCPGPSKPDSLSENRSMYQLSSRDGKVLYRRFITDPRIILVEDPKEPVEIADKARFTLRIPLGGEGKRAVRLDEAYVFEFYQQGRDPGKAAASVEVAELVQNFAKSRSAGEPAPCQIKTPDLSKLPPLKAGNSDALSADSAAKLIASDRGLLIRQGVEMDIRPDELRELVYKNRKSWPEFNIREKQVSQFLEEYEAQYSRANSKRAN